MKPLQRIIILTYSGLMLATSLIPMETGLEEGASGTSWVSSLSPAWQNVLHLPMFAVFVLLLLNGTKASPFRSTNKPLGVILLALGFGVVLELLQFPVPGRYPSINDTLFNFFGTAIGVLLHIGRMRFLSLS